MAEFLQTGLGTALLIAAQSLLIIGWFRAPLKVVTLRVSGYV